MGISKTIMFNRNNIQCILYVITEVYSFFLFVLSVQKILLCLLLRHMTATVVQHKKVYIHSKETPEDGPLRSETCRADTYASINNQYCYIVYLVGMYIYIAKNDTRTFQCQVPMTRKYVYKSWIENFRNFCWWTKHFVIYTMRSAKSNPKNAVLY